MLQNLAKVTSPLVVANVIFQSIYTVNIDKLCKYIYMYIYIQYIYTVMVKIDGTPGKYDQKWV